MLGGLTLAEMPYSTAMPLPLIVSASPPTYLPTCPHPVELTASKITDPRRLDPSSTAGSTSGVVVVRTQNRRVDGLVAAVVRSLATERPGGGCRCTRGQQRRQRECSEFPT
jgi:hypothetical protein